MFTIAGCKQDSVGCLIVTIVNSKSLEEEMRYFGEHLVIKGN